MRIGLFGGTFNPIHFGHLRPVLEIKESFSLDRVFFIPSALPPHKAATGIAEAQDRYRMIELAIAGQKGFAVSDVELHRPGPSYSIDTVSHFQSSLPDTTRLYLILGVDAFLEIDTWKSFQEFFKRVPFIVMSRPMEEPSLQKPLTQHGMDAWIKEKLSEKYRYSPEDSGYLHEEKQPIFKAEVTGLNISATKIRSLVRRGKSVRYLLPDAVAGYIQTKGLYE